MGASKQKHSTSLLLGYILNFITNDDTDVFFMIRTGVVGITKAVNFLKYTLECYSIINTWVFSSQMQVH